MSRQNKFESGPFSALSACANKAVVIVTSPFSKTKGFFCFSFNKRFPDDVLGKMCFFAYGLFKKGSKLQGKNMQNIFKTPKPNCLQNLERFWKSSLLSKIPNALLPLNSSISGPSLTLLGAKYKRSSGEENKIQTTSKWQSRNKLVNWNLRPDNFSENRILLSC